jgi:hypothetical protein
VSVIFYQIILKKAIFSGRFKKIYEFKFLKQRPIFFTFRQKSFDRDELNQGRYPNQHPKAKTTFWLTGTRAACAPT